MIIARIFKLNKTEFEYENIETNCPVCKLPPTISLAPNQQIAKVEMLRTAITTNALSDIIFCAIENNL